jgi:hypothetical protein
MMSNEPKSQDTRDELGPTDELDDEQLDSVVGGVSNAFNSGIQTLPSPTNDLGPDNIQKKH